MTIRFSILAGVSTDAQVQDHDSIPDQIATCRRVIEQLDGIETACYVFDGYSRSGYDSLADAMRDIPPLKDAVEAAEQNKYDVLILDNWDRLGDLGQLVHTRFKRYRKQIYSARQSGRLYDPDKYEPHMDESGGIDMHVQAIIQQYRINKLRRGLILGVKKRVEEGKYSINFPYGYIKEKDGSLVLDAPVSQLLIRLKDLFLGGASLRQLTQVALASGVPSARGGKWAGSTIAGILKNPFYAGKVFNNRWKMVAHNKANRMSTMKLNPGVTYYDGKHPALWDWETHLRIVDEIKERYKQHPRYKARNFSGLLVCSVCGKRLMFKQGRYRCYPAPDHIRLKEADANAQIGVELAKALKDLKNYRDAPPVKSSADTAQDAIAAIERQISKVQRGFENEIYTAAEAKGKIDGLRAQIKTIQAGQDDAERRLMSHQRLLSKRDELLPNLDQLPEMFADNAPKANNRFLRDILTAIYVTPEHTFRFDFR